MIRFVERNTETLSNYISRIMMNKHLDTYDVHRRSGGEISQSYVVKLKNGNITNIGIKKLKALAKGLGEPEIEVIAVAQGSNPNKSLIMDERFENMSLKFSGLPEEKKGRLETLIDMMDREIERVAEDH